MHKAEYCISSSSSLLWTEFLLECYNSLDGKLSVSSRSTSDVISGFDMNLYFPKNELFAHVFCLVFALTSYLCIASFIIVLETSIFNCPRDLSCEIVHIVSSSCSKRLHHILKLFIKII